MGREAMPQRLAHEAEAEEPPLSPSMRHMGEVRLLCSLPSSFTFFAMLCLRYVYHEYQHPSHWRQGSRRGDLTFISMMLSKTYMQRRREESVQKRC